MSKEQELIPATLAGVIEALCRDYPRRAHALQAGEESERTRMEYAYINARLFAAAMGECDSEEEALLYMEEIGARRGYAKSTVTVSETTYKEKKTRIRRAMVRLLHLLG